MVFEFGGTLHMSYCFMYKHKLCQTAISYIFELHAKILYMLVLLSGVLSLYYIMFTNT